MGDWQLERLGWRAFQDLATTMLSTVFGQSVESFEDGNDEGRDASFTGIWNDPHGTEALSGAFVIQSKFSSSRGTLTLSGLQQELPKIKNLQERGLCDNYIVMTNQRVTGSANAAIREAVMGLGVKQVRVWGRTWIEQKLDTDPALRRRVPRLYGLGDLTEILDERRLLQGKSILNALGSSAATFVPTSPFYDAADALDDHGAVLLIGRPTVGKSVIAQMLALGVLDSGEADVVVATSAEDFTKVWNPSLTDRLFWVDDVFGELTAEAALIGSWGRNMRALLAAVGHGNRFIFTSRDYIYRDAVTQLRSANVPFWNDAQITVAVAELTATERRRILYNHLKLGTQELSFKSHLKPHLETVADLDGFTPGLAFRLGNARFTATLDPEDEDSVVSFFEHPADYLDELLSELAPRDRASLGLLFAAGRRLDFPLGDTSRAAELLGRLGGDLGGLDRSLQSLDGTFVRHQPLGVSGSWTFAHPTIREATNRMLQSSAVAVDALIEGTPIEELVPQIDLRGSEATDSSLTGRMLVLDTTVGIQVIDLIIARLDHENRADFQFQHAVTILLSHRATPLLRRRFATVGMRYIRRWARQTRLPWIVALIGQLFHEESLPSGAREVAVEALTADASSLRSAAWTEVDWITEDERFAIFQSVSLALQDTTDLFRQIVEVYDISSDPESHLDDYWTTLEALKDLDDAGCELLTDLDQFEQQLAICSDELQQLSIYGEIDDRDDYERDRERDRDDLNTPETTRSIFDDVDE